MNYGNMVKGLFLERPNRFLAVVEIGGRREICHVKNTGRLKELLLPGETVVYLEDHGIRKERKTRYSLTAVIKDKKIVNIDSQAPNKVVGEWIRKGGLLTGLTFLKAEQRYESSRFDFYALAGGKRVFIEVKGVTLEENGTALFPDAPTIRGVKHIRELCRAVEEGFEAYILFIIQMSGVSAFEPNERAQAEFKAALCLARDAGVHVMARECRVWEGGLEMGGEVKVHM